jgi:hypothetical protein
MRLETISRKAERLNHVILRLSMTLWRIENPRRREVSLIGQAMTTIARVQAACREDEDEIILLEVLRRTMREFVGSAPYLPANSVAGTDPSPLDLPESSLLRTTSRS